MPASTPPFTGRNAPEAILTSLLLIHSLDIHSQLVWNAPSWTISVEFYTYLVYGALVVAWPRRPLLGAASMAIVGFLGVAFVARQLAANYDYGIFRCFYGLLLRRPDLAPVAGGAAAAGAAPRRRDAARNGHDGRRVRLHGAVGRPALRFRRAAGVLRLHPRLRRRGRAGDGGPALAAAGAARGDLLFAVSRALPRGGLHRSHAEVARALPARRFLRARRPRLRRRDPDPVPLEMVHGRRVDGLSRTRHSRVHANLPLHRGARPPVLQQAAAFARRGRSRWHRGTAGAAHDRAIS